MKLNVDRKQRRWIIAGLVTAIVANVEVMTMFWVNGGSVVAIAACTAVAVIIILGEPTEGSNE